MPLEISPAASASHHTDKAPASSAFSPLERGVVREATRGVKIGAVVAMLLQALFMLANYLLLPQVPLWMFAFYLTTFSVAAVAIFVASTKAFECHWRAIVMALLLTLTANFTGAGLLLETTLTTALSLILVSFSAATFVPWEPWYQFVLNLACVAALAVCRLLSPGTRSLGAQYEEIALLATVLITQFGVFFLSSWRRTAYETMAKLLAHERDLTKKNAEIELLTGNLLDIVTVLDGAGGFIDISKSVERILGYAREELIGRSVFEIMHPEDHGAVAKAIAEAAAAPGEAKSVHCRLQHKNSGWRVVAAVGQAVIAAPAHDGGSPDLTIIASLRDVTESINQEQSQALWSAFAEASDDAFAVATPDGIYVSCNPAAERMFGYGAEEIIGRHFSDFIPDELRREFRDVIERLERGQKIEDFETQRRRKDGGMFEVALTISPIRMKSGQPLGYATIVRDITQRKRIEQTLRENEAKFRTLFDANLDSVTLNALGDGRFVDVNEGFLKVSGYTREELIGKTPRDLGIWTDLEKLREVQREVVNRGVVKNIETTLRFKDDVLAPSLFAAVRVEIAGKPFMLAISHDIRGIKETQAKLMASETRFRRIFEENFDAIAINSLEDGKYLDASPGGERMTGYRRDEVIGKTPGELGIWANPGQLREVMRELRATGLVRNFNALLRARDGHHINALFSASIVELDGRPCMLSFTHDITEFKRAERELIAAREELAAQIEALKHSQQQLNAEITERRLTQRKAEETAATLRKIFEVSSDTITINRLEDGSYIDLNQGFIAASGFDKQRTLGNSAGRLGLWAEKSQLKAFLARLREQGSVRNMEADFATRTGRASCLISADIVELAGEPCIVSIVRDVSQLKRTEGKLVEALAAAEAASRAKSAFLSSMSHEIRTPMNVVFGMTEVLSEMPLSAEMRRCVDVMKSNGAALLSLINDILDLARIESGKLDLEHVEFDLEELLEAAAETIAIRAHEKGLELLVRLAPETPRRLVGDPLRLRQIMLNFLSNAIKFTHAGEVVLAVEKDPAAEPGTLRFSVADTGIGIPADNLKDIFSSFTKADSSITRKYGGSGLGLAIVQRLSQVMGGRVWAESVAGKGSTFYFSVNMGVSATATAKPAVPAGLHILVIDDSATNRTLLREMLDDCSVDGAAGAQDALLALANARERNLPYELILLDWRMPETDGDALVREIRNRAGFSARIIAMLTSHELGVQVAQVRECGLHYLVKPIKRSELHAIIEATHDLVPAKTATPRLRTTETGAVRRLHILLAEDSADNRLLIELYLKNTDCYLDHAENGEIAVQKFVSGKYDLILMDNQMPVMDGLSATRTIRRWELEKQRSPTPIVALTASALNEDVSRSLAAGCNLHLSKPLQKAALFEAIRTLTENADGGNERQGEDLVVTVDPDLSDLIPGFLARKREEAKAALVALEKADYETLLRLGHRFKGEGGAYGFNAITRLGAELERCATGKDLDSARRAALALEDYLERVRVFATLSN